MNSSDSLARLSPQELSLFEMTEKYRRYCVRSILKYCIASRAIGRYGWCNHLMESKVLPLGDAAIAVLLYEIVKAAYSEKTSGSGPKGGTPADLAICNLYKFGPRAIEALLFHLRYRKLNGVNLDPFELTISYFKSPEAIRYILAFLDARMGNTLDSNQQNPDIDKMILSALRNMLAQDSGLATEMAKGLSSGFATRRILSAVKSILPSGDVSGRLVLAAAVIGDEPNPIRQIGLLGAIQILDGLTVDLVDSLDLMFKRLNKSDRIGCVARLHLDVYDRNRDQIYDSESPDFEDCHISDNVAGVLAALLYRNRMLSLIRIASKASAELMSVISPVCSQGMSGPPGFYPGGASWEPALVAATNKIIAIRASFNVWQRLYALQWFMGQHQGCVYTVMVETLLRIWIGDVRLFDSTQLKHYPGDSCVGVIRARDGEGIADDDYELPSDQLLKRFEDEEQ